MDRPALFLSLVVGLVWSVTLPAVSLAQTTASPGDPRSASAASKAEAGSRANFIHDGEIDLIELLPPPPPPGSAQSQAELQQIEAFQQERTPAIVARVIADSKENVFGLVAGVFGPSFTPERVPVTAAFFDRIETDEWRLTRAPKKYFARLRPPLVDGAVRPCLPLPKSPSYPSSHATMAQLMAIVLAAELPEQKDAIFARAQEYARDRVVAGVHFPSDVEAGRVAGTVIAAFMLRDPDFQAAFSQSRVELRLSLGLP